MNRRKLITLLGGATVAWPLAAHAQQAAMPVIGFVRSTRAAPSEGLETAFKQGLKEAALIEGQNVAIETRYAEDQSDRLPALVAELIRRRAVAIVGNTIAALTAKAASTTIPIIFATGGDPVELGLVASFNRPGGNVTGVVFFSSGLAAKRLELLRRLVPTFLRR